MLQPGPVGIDVPGFGLRVALPIGGLMALAVGLLFAVMLWTASEQNRLARNLQERLAAGALAAAEQDVGRRVYDYAVWDDAAQKLALDLDRAWADENIGWATGFLGLEFAFVLNSAAKALYGVAGSGPADVAEAALAADLHRLVQVVRFGGGEGAASGLTRAGPSPAVLAVHRIVPHSANLSLPTEAERFLIYVDVLDPARLGELGALYLLPDLRHVEIPVAGGGQALTSVSGTPLGHLIFTPERPGAALLRRLLPPLGALALGLGIASILVLVQARRVSTLLRASEMRAATDPLTGLPNRVLLRDRISWHLARKEDGRSGVALLCLDLDGFKPVNDALGHAAGDELLVQVARRLEGCARERDVVARLGGDEFVIVLPDAGSEAVGVGYAERALAALEMPFQLEAAITRIGASVGIVHAACGSDHDVDSLLRAADRALYDAKQAGRHTWRVSGKAAPDAGMRSTIALAGCETVGPQREMTTLA